MFERIRRLLPGRPRRRLVATADPQLVQGLLDLAAALAVEPDLDGVLERVCERMRELVNCDRSSIFVLEDGSYRARYNAGNPPDIAKAFEHFRVEPSDRLVRRAFETSRAVTVNDTLQSPLMNERFARAARINAIVLVPICSAKGAPLAFLTVEFNERKAEFNETEAVFVDGIAKIIALSIQQHASRQELESSRELVRRNERLTSVGTFAAGIVHQVNNPIGSILIAADLARSRKGEPDELETSRESLDSIARAATRCGQILRSVLRFSRDEVNEKWICDLGEIMTEVVESQQSYALALGASIEFDRVKESLPSIINPLEIEQALANVLRNAIESRAEGARVSVRIRAELDRVLIVVEDDGPGIAEEDRRHAFDPFYTTRADQGGSGLGLSVAHGIVLEHGGVIEIAEREGPGTTVLISLPRIPAD